MKKTLLLTVISVWTTISFGQHHSDKNNQPDSVVVFVSFIVETNGSITHINTNKIKCKLCSNEYKKNIENEAIRVVKEMPKRNGHKQKTKYVLPLTFKRED